MGCVVPIVYFKPFRMMSRDNEQPVYVLSAWAYLFREVQSQVNIVGV